MKWQIYHKDGSLLFETDNIIYSGEWMGDEYVTTKIKSAEPLDFEIGDYITYRGERYTLNVIPTVQKSARHSSVVEAFVYDNVKFYSSSDELTRCKFLDVVLHQNQSYYTGLPDFTFYALSVEDLADRLKANLDRLYKGENLWTIKVYLGEDNYYTAGDPVSSHNLAGGEKNKPITVSNLSCWEALALVQSEFDLNFVIRNHTVIIGDTGTLLSRYFEYGKDKGLFKIDRTTDDSQQVVTRLRVYGNRTNMPTRYYANLEGSALPNNLNCQRLMLPAFPKRTLADWAKDPENKDEFTGSYSEDILDPYIDSANVAVLGIREATIFFDGKDGEDIYPSIEWIDDGTEAHNPVNVVTVGSDIEDDGLFEEGESIPDFYITIADIGFDINDYLTEETATISMKDGMCGGREFTIAGCDKVSGGYRLRLQRKEDVGVYYPTRIFKIEPNNKFVLLNISLPKEYVEAASKALLAKAKEWLAKNDYVAYKYSLSVDELFMARQHDLHIQNREESLHDTIKAGSVLRFVDPDLLVSGSITIDRIEIKEGEHSLPQYTINLTEEKTVGTLQRIQQQIDSIANGGGGGGYNLSEIETVIRNYGNQHYLRKDVEDSAKREITFEQGASFGEYVNSLIFGKGANIDGNGNAQVESIEVRSYMKVMELIYNRLSANEGDYVFTDSGTIESIVLENDGTYTATLRKRFDNDFHSFQEGDVIRGVVNNLESTGEYYTAWARVSSVNTANNTISLVVYDDSQVPAKKNYPPTASMVINRWGNAITPTDGSYNPRQTSWYISSTEGRIVFLQGVTKPILDEENYSGFFGLPVNLSCLSTLNLNPNQPYLYAKGVAVEDFQEIDYQGYTVKSENYRGPWKYEDAISNTPYRVEGKKVDTVYHNGCKWQCLVDGTTQEPRYNSTDWVMVEGNNQFTVDILSSEGWGEFDIQHFSTTLSFRANLYNEDITEHILPIDVMWTRDTGNIAEDNAWAIKRGNSGKSIYLNTNDLGTDLSNMRSCKFTVTVTLRDGEEMMTATDDMTIN